jgi:hypothetical protein
VYLCFVIGSVSDFRRQSLENFEDAKGVIRNRKSKKNSQHNGQKDKQRSTKHTHKTKDRVTRTPQMMHSILVITFLHYQMPIRQVAL